MEKRVFDAKGMVGGYTMVREKGVDEGWKSESEIEQVRWTRFIFPRVM